MAPAPAALEALSAPRTARAGSAVRIRARFASVPSGRVALQVRRAGGWVTLALASPRSRTVGFAFRPTSAGPRVMRLRYRLGGRAVDTPISVSVRA